MLNAKVLVADDDPLTGALVSQALAVSGFEVCGPFKSADDVLLALRERPDVCLVDVYLSGDDGRTLAAEIIERCDTQVILMSIEEQPSSMVPFILKPFSLPSLVGRVRSSLREREALASFLRIA